ncbi:hypothetical protein GE21DRAFT_7473 [Neurospora crassa]|uniref:Uncharacterized protein n=2 Tax=Neurospora crassa TaxID=5141 RepID=Q1K8B2_NEUCR|nr:hypothetical protein NCU01054 [Neurospora crassa OR74A]EAA32430.1 hypothetical protein NCU01054 [Neurospora crassa OR74A]KHE88327.1 hypothetical protein GE21DRAFT_7473 [Neurospora crassa]CAD21292.1 hypothetical protein [Neurospora crassa]|eukprot:XP_961666.1 hypothetical protein NCU01054 [Neurospora crassa OR74A]
MSSNHSAPKKYLTLYRDGSLGSALIEAMDELILAGRFPIIPGAALDHPINLTTEPTGSEAGDPIDITGTTTTTEPSSPAISMNTSTSTRASSSSSSTTPRDVRPQLQSQPQQQRQQTLASLTQKLTDHVLTTFDRVIAQTLATHDEVINKIPVIKMKGKLKQYRLVDDIWKLWVEDVEIAVGSERRRRRRRGRPGNVEADLRDGGSSGSGGKGELGAKRKRDEHEDGDSEERAGKRSRGDGGNGIEQSKKDDDGKGPEVFRVDKLLIVACDGREPDAGKKKKRGG